MREFTSRFGDAILGVASGFDRIVFQGMIRPLMYPEGAMGFFRRRRIAFKDAKDWVLAQTKSLVAAVEEYSQEQCGRGITYLPSSRTRKEEVARERQAETTGTTGLIGTWSCVEAGSSIRLAPAEGAPKLIPVWTRCKHLYLYLNHQDYGFMNIRIQTWFPYRIQIAMNGREWLVRQLERAGIGFERQGSKILRVDDFERMQSLLHQQLRTDWCLLLNSFVPLGFPTFGSTLGTDLSYSWYLWQSEWASDVVFKDRRVLDELMIAFVRHAFIGAYPGRLLRYFGRPVKQDGQPYRKAHDSLSTKILEMDEGFRIRHWLGSNSTKMYNQHNVLRFETTINDPTVFRGYRRKQNAPKTDNKELLPLRKGVADTTLRALVSQEVNNRLAEHVATTQTSQPFRCVLETVTNRKRRRGRSVPGLDPTGKDLAPLNAIADPRFTLTGLRNKDLRIIAKQI